jgi:hypothetical protein
VQDLDGNPLEGYPVHIWGAGIDTVVTAGVEPRFNLLYGSEAAWEQYFGPSPRVMEIHVQLHTPFADGNPPVSDEIVVDFPGHCGGALAYLAFTKNH